MLLASRSHIGSDPIMSVIIAHVMLRLCWFYLGGTKKTFSSTIDNLKYLITKINETCQFGSYKHSILSLCLIDLFFSYIFGFKRYLRKLICLGFHYDRFWPFFSFIKRSTYLSIFSYILYKKSITSNITNKETKKKRLILTYSPILRIFGVSLILIAIKYKKQNELKQQFDVIKTITGFWKKAIITPNVPQFCLNENDIIWGVGLGCVKELMDQGQSYSQMNINISYCSFSRYSSYSGDGGVIHLYGSYSMNANYTMFYNCVCSQSGGAIHLSSSNSFLRMICAYRCSCGAEFLNHFAYLKASQMNNVDYLSVAYCSHTTSGYYPINLYTGNQSFSNTNSSMNNAIAISGINVNYPSSFTSSHCTFSNNKVSENRCIHFYSTSGTISMSYANIVQNNSPSQYGVVYAEGAGSKKMLYCIFQNNTNYLFCVHSGSLEVSHSFMNHSSSSFSRSAAVSTENNNSFTNIMTYQIQFFNSHHCNTDVPPPLKTIDQSAERTLEETSRITMVKTMDQTLCVTPNNTPNDTQMNTLLESPINTFDQTMRETQIVTPYRSYENLICTNQMSKAREISVTFTFSFFVLSDIL